MTADVRVALFGPAADFWRGALPHRIVMENLTEGDEANVWVVNADEVPDEVPDGCHVIVFALGAAYESDLPNLWETVETPERWVPAMYAALAEGRDLVSALKIGGPTPIRLDGKDPQLKKIVTPRNVAANPNAKRGPGLRPKVAAAEEAPAAAKKAPAKKATAKKAAAKKAPAKKAAAKKTAK
ncbi:hypothetical protein AADG42_17720 [Ammonicoccus fulvus]|uniref:Uncharacterized protein n=1 Tax=Ammonicoccus fulvus TaxID=3138240 RepID=A0ABZ3FSK4_9ACTN